MLDRIRQALTNQSLVPPVIIGVVAGVATLVVIMILRQPNHSLVLEFDESAREDLQPIWIDGAVQRPGLYLVPEDATLEHAIEVAGGLADDADLDSVGLDEAVSNRNQVVVPESAGPGSSTGDETIDLNTADTDQLEQLPGIGPVLAERIITYREEHGPFEAPEDLANVSGISTRMVEEFHDQVSVGN